MFKKISIILTDCCVSNKGLLVLQHRINGYFLTVLCCDNGNCWLLIVFIYRDNGWSEEEVFKIIIALQKRGLIKSMEFNSFTRIHHEDTEIKVVKQMPTIASNKQPTIAIITAQYCEKVAVDSMLENKETFVRYTTVG